MYNPMTTQYLRELLTILSPLKQAFLAAVDDFAYQSTWPMESRLPSHHIFMMIITEVLHLMRLRP
jgi:hypothetical protein